MLYTVGIYLYGGLIRLAGFWNEKARLWIKGREKTWDQLIEFQNLTTKKAPVIWIHCASLGEFEQGRPLVEKIRATLPAVKMVLSFFSPSGYEIRKHYDQVDLVIYMPLDTPQNARKFVQALRPDLAIFVKYEFWHHHLHALAGAGIPILLISAIFRSEQVFFRAYGFWYRKLLALFDRIFVQDETSGQLLDSIGIDRHVRVGDTRVDRVLQLRQQAKPLPEIGRFTGAAPVWIAGSTWPPDEALLFPFWADHLPPDWKMIIAPHDIGETHIREIEDQCPIPVVRYSRLAEAGTLNPEIRVLIVDNIGMLSSLYRYGRIAYIGGGFGKAIHNLLEPIAFSLPVIFGPKHEKFQEALALKNSGGGFAITSAEELRTVFNYLQDPDHYAAAASRAFGYLEQSRGSTEKIMQYLTSAYSDRLGP